MSAAFLSESTARQLRTLVALPSLAQSRQVSLESLDPAEAAQKPPQVEDVVQRLTSALATSNGGGSPVASTNPTEYGRALTVLTQKAAETTRKMHEDPGAPLTPGDAMALEAVIRADGTRPSFTIRDGIVDPKHQDNPLTGSWGDLIDSTRSTLAAAIRAIGRVEPEHPTARNYFGTAWVINTGAGSALTNLHVAEAIWKRLPHLMERTARGFRVRGGVYVDFIGEAGNQASSRFRVIEAVFNPQTDGPGFTRLDAAVLRLEPASPDQADLPPALGISTNLDGPDGNLASFCTVGFPGPPQYFGGLHEGVDWNWVNSTLFGNLYGVKRLAPGLTHRPLGSVQDDARRWIFGHDITTLGGCSGSPLLNWSEAKPKSFGLHFAGSTLDSNYAHALGACAGELEELGVPTRGPG